MPMARPPREEIYNGLFEAKHVTRYLENYVNAHIYQGRSLRDRIVFGFNVENVDKIDAHWVVHGRSAAERPKFFRASKLIVASGLTSVPNMPALPNGKDFSGQIVHQEGFGSSRTLESPEIKQVAVLGGGKSAADMVYACSKAGKSVSWIIRRSGSGPSIFLGSEGMGPYKNSTELGATRALVAASSSFFSTDSLFARFLDQTTLGRWLVRSVWSGVDKKSQAIFGSVAEAQNGFEKLKSNGQ